jgi:hypothetical protein
VKLLNLGVIFPKTQYQELHRITHQWRNLKQWKWSGAAHMQNAPDGPGSHALFCVACPQPGINLPKDWKNDPDETSYIRSFVMDGNFTAVHQRRKNALPETNLTNGELYMVNEPQYQRHLTTATEHKEVSLASLAFRVWYLLNFIPARH